MMQHRLSGASRLGLLAILLAAFALVTYSLANQSLWYDEAVTAQVTARGVADLTRWTAGDIQPPLYYYVVAGWTRLAGREEWALRFPSACFAVLLAATLWALARRLFGKGRRGAAAGLVAAAFSAVSPLYVYYGQEARMYTLLTWLGALAGYCLLRAMQARGAAAGRRWWAGWAGAAAAAMYTHYFAAFLLLAQGVYFLVVWAGARLHPAARPADVRAEAPRWGEIRPAGLAALAVVVVYLPWLPAMLGRYQVDRSYWQGALKLGEALRHLAISFTTGAPETMLEAEALRWLPWFGGAVVVCLAALALRAREQRSKRAGEKLPCSAAPLLYVILTLVIPVLCVLALASRTPKFNARYLILASPAYLLILAGGVGTLITADRATAAHTEGAKGSLLRSRIRAGACLVLAAAVLTLCGLAGSRSIGNWFNDPSFNKAQWRQLVSFVQRQAGPDEAVLLVSGHAAPAWDYYAPGRPAAGLPAIDILDVNAVLGYKDSAALAETLAGKSGVWVVFWQSEAVDPAGFVPYFLDRAGVEVPQAREFWQLGLRHWRLDPAASFPPGPQPQHPDGANFGHKIALLGWDDPAAGQVTLYWQALNTIGPHDYQVSLAWEDAAGRPAGPRWDGRPAGYLYPTGRWQPGAPLFGRYPLPEGLPAGRYYVAVAVYDSAAPSGLDVMDVADNPAGKRVRLGPITLER